MINQYEIQAKNDDGTWETCVEFSGKQYDTQEAMDMMIDRLQMYRDAYKDFQNTTIEDDACKDTISKFRLVHITQRTLA
jgi:hypothetical protein